MENIAGFMKRHPVASFFILAFAVPWPLLIILYVYLQITGTPANVTQAGAVALLLMFLAEGFASAAGIVMTFSIGGREGMKELLGRLKRWRAGITWYAAAILTTSVAATAVLVALAVTISPHFLPALLKGQNILAAIPFVIFFGLMAGLLEEFGWTGFALPRLLARYPAFRAALTLGIVWGLWHILLITWVWPTASSPNLVLQIGTGIIWCGALVPYRILMSWVYINTKSSLLIAIIMHAFYDASLALFVPATLSPVEILEFYAALNVILWIFVGTVVLIFGAKTMARTKPQIPAVTMEPV